MVFNHAFDVQIFEADDAVMVDYFSGFFLQKVSPGIGNLVVNAVDSLQLLVPVP